MRIKIYREKKWKKKKLAKNRRLIKYSLILYLGILLLIEKIVFKKSENNPIFFINKQESKQNNKDLYNNENNGTEKFNNTQNPVFKTISESFESAKDFLEAGIKGILIQDKQKFILSENPLVSVVIPLYNCKKYILRALRSIQNQNIYNFEIILVNDFSKDDTLSIIENIKREDPRIKLINNTKNMGILYSKSIGVLAAKGKYIFPLDNDDMFLDKDVFETVTNIAESGSFDIVEFKGIESFVGSSDISKNAIKNIHFTRRKKVLNLVMIQPELGKFPIQPYPNLIGYNVYDAYIWGKCIKTEMYQKAVNNLGKEKYSRYMLAHEDVLMIYVLFYTIKSFKFIGKYGIFHIKRGISSWIKSLYIPHYITVMELYFLDVVLDFPKNSIESKILSVSIMNLIMRKGDLEGMLNYKEYYKNLFYSCLERIFNSTLVSNDLKNILRVRGKKLSFLNYTF